MSPNRAVEQFAAPPAGCDNAVLGQRASDTGARRSRSPSHMAAGEARSRDYTGMTFDQIVRIMGLPPTRVSARLANLHYQRRENGRYYPRSTVVEIEDEIAARRAACPPVAPCFRCGCRVCACMAGRAA